MCRQWFVHSFGISKFKTALVFRILEFATRLWIMLAASDSAANSSLMITGPTTDEWRCRYRLGACYVLCDEKGDTLVVCASSSIVHATTFGSSGCIDRHNIARCPTESWLHLPHQFQVTRNVLPRHFFLMATKKRPRPDVDAGSWSSSPVLAPASTATRAAPLPTFERQAENLRQGNKQLPLFLHYAVLFSGFCVQHSCLHSKCPRAAEPNHKHDRFNHYYKWQSHYWQHRADRHCAVHCQLVPSCVARSTWPCNNYVFSAYFYRCTSFFCRSQHREWLRNRLRLDAWPSCHFLPIKRSAGFKYNCFNWRNSNSERV